MAALIGAGGDGSREPGTYTAPWRAAPRARAPAARLRLRQFRRGRARRWRILRPATQVDFTVIGSLLRPIPAAQSAAALISGMAHVAAMIRRRRSAGPAVPPSSKTEGGGPALLQEPAAVSPAIPRSVCPK